MSQKSSTFIQETRERETWLGTLPVEGAEEREREQMLATAALVRGSLQSIPVPEEAEARARAAAVAEMQRRQVFRDEEAPQAPWYLRLGHFMRFVFTLGRRR